MDPSNLLDLYQSYLKNKKKNIKFSLKQK